METLQQAEDRRAQWDVPRHGRHMQCYHCGHVADHHQTINGRRVLVCGGSHDRDGQRTD